MERFWSSACCSGLRLSPLRISGDVEEADGRLCEGSISCNFELNRTAVFRA